MREATTHSVDINTVDVKSKGFGCGFRHSWILPPLRTGAGSSHAMPNCPLLSGLTGRDSRGHSGNASRQSVTPDDAAAVPYRLVYRSWFASISDCGNGEISPISFA